MDTKGKYNNGYVYSAIKSIIYELVNSKDNSYIKAKLANFRNSIGRESNLPIDIWPILVKHIPNEYIGKNSELTAGEQAILHTMQLYALYNQGNSESFLIFENDSSWENMGTSFAELRNKKENSEKVAIDRRFNIMVTSETYNEFLYHLRQMIRLLKTKINSQVDIDFPKLGQDLFIFIKGKEESIRIQWSREYYRNRYVGKEKSKGEKNENK